MFQPPRDPYERKFKDIQAALKNHEQRIVDLQKHAATPRLPASARSDATRQAYLETMRDFQRTNESYVNIISLLGFGGLFTLWVHLEGAMTLWLKAATGLLMAVSLAVFVVFELIKAYSISKVPEDDPKKWHEDVDKALAHQRRIWPRFFFGSAIPGLVSAVALMAFMFIKALGL